MKTLTKVTLVSLMLAGTLGFAAQAAHHQGGEYGGDGKHHGKGGHHQRGQHGEMGKMLRGLDLSAEQKATIEDLMEQAKADRQERKTDAEREAMRAEHQALMNADTFDEAAAKAFIAKKQATQEAHQLARMKLHYDILQVLTDEQKAELEARKEERRAKHAEKRAERGNR